jgi:hypothetical protein
MNAKAISGMEPGSRATDRGSFVLRASAIARPTIGGTMSERASLFAKSDDDVGPPRAMREQQAQTKL